jgi:hypothetical protein
VSLEQDITGIKEADIFKGASEEELKARKDTTGFPEFRVTFYYEVGGDCWIRARSAADARALVTDHALDYTHRDWNIIDVKKEKTI